MDQVWAAARYHSGAKNRARAAEFGQEAFKILEWARRQDYFTSTLDRIDRRARASAHRLDARYLLDGDRPGAALAAWTRALFLHPPTALARLNIMASSILNLLGLAALRQAILDRRKASLR